MGSEQSILSDNKIGSPVEAIETRILTLSSGFILKLERTFYVPSFSQNLIFVCKLIPFGYSFKFKDTLFELFYNSECARNGILPGGLYLLGLQNDVTYSSMHVQTCIKMCHINENSSMLWNQRLGHISIERIKRLVKDRILNNLDFDDFKTCVDCIKGK